MVLSAAGDPLERLSDMVEFELFRPVLEGDAPLEAGQGGARPTADAHT